MTAQTARMLTDAVGNLIDQRYDSTTDTFVANKGINGVPLVTETMRGASALAALGAVTKTVPTIGLALPSTFTLKSIDATRKIEFSTDGGVEYFTPAYDVVSGTMLVASTRAGISHVKFTGALTDNWSNS